MYGPNGFLGLARVISCRAGLRWVGPFSTRVIPLEGLMLTTNGDQEDQRSSLSKIFGISGLWFQGNPMLLFRILPVTYFTGKWLTTGIRLTHGNHGKIKSTFYYLNQ